jgi:hypothetical protein
VTIFASKGYYNQMFCASSNVQSSQQIIGWAERTRKSLVIMTSGGRLITLDKGITLCTAVVIRMKKI